MSKLTEIENLRKSLVTEIMRITGFTIDEVVVDISLSVEGDEDDLAIEAREVGWHPDRKDESAWYTTEIPGGGSTTVFVE